MGSESHRRIVLRAATLLALLSATAIPIGATSQARTPPRRYLIVAAVSPGYRQIVEIVSSAGLVARVVASKSTSNSFGAKWSPDGSMLAWVSADGLTVERADGRSRRTLVPASTGCSQLCVPMTFAWSPDGKRLLVGGVGTQTRHLQLVSVRTGHRVDLVRARAYTGYWAVGWSSDAHTIAFRRSSAEPSGSVHEELFVAASDGIKAHRLFSAAEPHDSPAAALAPNGRFVAFSTEGRDRRDPRLAVIDLRSGKTHVIRGVNGGPPTWSPDSRRIAVPTAVVTLTPSGGRGKIHALGTGAGIAVWTRSGDVVIVAGAESRNVLRSKGGRGPVHLLFRLPKNHGILTIDPK